MGQHGYGIGGNGFALAPMSELSDQYYACDLPLNAKM